MPDPELPPEDRPEQQMGAPLTPPGSPAPTRELSKSAEGPAELLTAARQLEVKDDLRRAGCTGDAMVPAVVRFSQTDRSPD